MKKMIKHDPTTKDENRRLLLNKKYVKSDLTERLNFTDNGNFTDNSALTNGNAGRSSVVLKLQNVNKRILAVVLAIAMVLGLLPAAINLIVKGASKDSAHTLTSLPYTVTAADETAHRFKSGDTYFYVNEAEGRTYTYEFDEPLIEGDVLTFNTDSKNIQWSRSGVYGIDNIVDANNNVAIVDDSDETSPVLSFAQDKNGGGSVIVSNKPYYYEAPNGTKYVFTFAEDVAKANRATVRSEQNVVTDYYEGTFILDLNDENSTASVEENDYQLHTYYIEENALTNGEVYLIEGEAEGIMIGYTGQTDGYITENYGTISGQSSNLTKYQLDLSKGGSYEIWQDAEPVLRQNNETFTGKRFYDGGYVLSESNNGTFSAYLLNEFQPAANGNYKILKAIVPESFTYSDDRILGHYYNTAGNRGVHIHQKTTRTHGLGTNNSNWSDWTYSTSTRKLTSRETSGNNNYDVLTINETSLQLNQSNNASALLNFKKVDAYYPVEDSKTVAMTVETPEDDGGTFPVKSISYTDNANIAGNYLEIDKTVSEVNRDEGTFDIKLEAYTTAPSLNQPATDIELVLDTSRNMSNVLYSREYKNLNTYEGFTQIDLTTGNVSHDKLFDRDTGNWGAAALELISRIFTGSRDYIHNKYVEDPNAPGTYVYLHQEYELQLLALRNRYKYYFTSCDGTTYETQDYTQNILGTALDPAPIPSTGLKFTATGHDDVYRDTIYTLSNYSGRNSDNGSAATNGELYNLVSDGKELYIKDNNGNFRRVYLYKDNLSNGTPRGVRKIGMYRYVVFENDQEYGTIEYEFCTGNTQILNDGLTSASYYGVFQGFRNYNEAHELEGDYILSKTLYVKEDEDVTALQAMKEALESFLLNAHVQVAAKDAEVYVGLVAYDRDAQVKYKLNENGSSGNYTDLTKTVGDHSVDRMISDIYNYRVTRQYDWVTRQMAYYNVINDSHHNGRWYSGTYAAEVDDGLALAKDELQYHNHDKPNPETGETIKSRRFAVLFTAGVPAAYTSFLGIDTSGDFTPATANRAIATANDIKSQLDTTVYSVGLFDNADEEKINGDYWYYATFGQKVKFNARTSPYWGGSWVANGFNIDPKDAYATNRMLAYISSDYSTPRTLGLTRDTFHPGRSGIWGWLSGGTGYRVDQTFSRDDKGYYLAVSPNTLIETDSTDDDDEYAHVTEDVAAILADVFQKLNIATAAPLNTLTDQSYLVDGITNYFDLDTSEVEVKAEVQYPDGTRDDVLSRDLEMDPASLSATTKTISVKGFNYSTHWIGDENGDNGRKLVLTFRVKRTDGMIGGNNIPTNLSKTAIYDGDPASITDITPWGIMEERFEIPKVDLPIEMSHFSTNDSIYYGGTEDLRDILDLSDLQEITLAGNNGTIMPNEFVTVEYEIKKGNNTVNTYTVPVGSTTGKWEHPIQDDAQADGTPGAVHEENLERIYVQPEESTKYTVNVVVKPVYNGTVPNTPFAGNDANVYVFLPHYETYNGTVDNAGDTYNLTATGKTPALTEWNYDEVLPLNGVDAEALLDKTEMPTVTYDLNKYNDEALTIPEEGKNKNTFTVNSGNVTQNTESIAGDLDDYTVNEKTDLIMRNVLITAAPREYTVEQKVADNYYDSLGVVYKTIAYNENLQPIETIYYDADGNVMPDATGPRDPGTYIDDEGVEQAITFIDTPEPEYGSVTKEYSPDTLNASQNNKVTFLNDDDERTNGAFTISLKSHDVIINNQTTGEAGSDYSDPNKEFPLTFTLKDGNTPVANETITFIDANGQQQTRTTDSNGQFTISMKDDDTITLKEIRDGYKLSITSTPAPGDMYTFAAQVALGDGQPTELNVPEDTEQTPDVTISDEAEFDLIHHIGDIPVTGFFDNEESSYGILIAILAALALGGGGYGAYRVYKPRKEEGSVS